MAELYDRVGGEFAVNSATDQFQGQPATARLASGEFVIVWSSFVSPGVFEVRGRLYESDGTPIGSEFPVTTTNGNLGDPRVTALSTGGFAVSWTYDVHDGTGTNAASGVALRIRAQLFDAEAAKVGGELTMSSGASANHSDSQLVALPSGGFALSYTRSTLADNVVDNDVVVQIFNPAGVSNGPLIVASATSTGNQSGTALASRAGGGFVAIWHDTNSSAAGDPSVQGVKGQLFDPVGVKVGSEFLVNSTTFGPQYLPSVASLESGGFVVAWIDLSVPGSDPAGNEVKAQIYNSLGVKVGGEFLVNTVSAGHQVAPHVAGLAGGGFVVGWQESTAASDVRAQVFDSTGAKLGLDFFLGSETEGGQTAPVLAGLADGGFVAAWNGTDASPPGVKAQVYAADAGAPTDITLSVDSIEETAIENVTVGILSTEGAVNSGFTYSIVGDSSGGAFRIEGDRLVVDDNAKLDYEAADEVTLTIRTTDSNGQSYDEAFTLGVLDVGYERRYSQQPVVEANLTEDGFEGSSKIVPLAGGGYALIWNQLNPNDPTPAKTVMRFFGADGAPESLEHVIAESWLGEYSVTPLVNGGLLIVRETSAPQVGSSVKAQAYDSGGNAVGPEITIGGGESGSAHAPTAVELSSGDYLISWVTAQGEVHAQRFTPEGVPSAEEIVIASSVESAPISVAATPPSGFVAAWIEPRLSSEDPFVVRADIYDVNDQLAARSVSIEVSALDIGDVTVIALPDGGYMLGWVETVGELDGLLLQVVMAQHLDWEWNLVGEPVELTGFVAESDFGEVSFAPHPDQGFVVLWPMIDVSTGEIAHRFLGSLFNECGCPVGSAFEGAALGFGGVATVLADGTIATSWSGPDSDETGVFTRVFRPADEPFEDVTDDVLVGDSEPNTLDGAGGDDQIYGFEGDDVLTGGLGNDLIDGGTGADTMTGGPGNDVYVVDQAGDVVDENPGEGTDEIHTDLPVFSLAGLPDIENLSGTSTGNHSLTGNAAGNSIHGNVGNDFIFLQAGGDDSAYGGDGNDVILFGASMTWTDFVDGGEGLDQLVLQGNYVGGSALLFGGGVVGIENIAILPGDDTRFGDPGTNLYDYSLTLQDAAVAEGVQLVVDANRLRAGEDFTFDGSAESDGSFFIYGGGGTDILFGGANNDVFLFGAWGQWNPADVVVGGSGIDQLALRGNYSLTFGAGQLFGIENIGLLSAHDTRFGALGSSYSYDLTMVDGNVASGVQMVVDGAKLRVAEFFRFDGSAELDGSFRVFGGLVDDTIVASRNNDFLQGNGGLDTLTGGLGADIFRYLSASDSTVAAADKILDFTPGTDKIDLSRIDANSHVAGDQAFSWIGSTAFAGGGAASAGQLRAYQSGQSWFVEGDIDGNGSADFRIDLTLVGPTSLGSGDFLL
jgi:Ca2+-binding RTX toxin-like protein